jgi:hypothetical protein
MVAPLILRLLISSESVKVSHSFMKEIQLRLLAHSPTSNLILFKELLSQQTLDMIGNYFLSQLGIVAMVPSLLWSASSLPPSLLTRCLPSVH